MVIRNFFKIFLRDKTITLVFLFAVFINSIIWFNLLRIPKTDEILPLHYNIYFGIDYMGGWYSLFIVPLFGLFVLLFNFSLSLFLYFNNKFLSYSLSLVALFVQIILLIASFAVVWINI